jgi:hypothetical protein
MNTKVSRFYIPPTNDELNDGYVEDLLKEEADKYEEELKHNQTDYLRVDL